MAKLVETFFLLQNLFWETRCVFLFFLCVCNIIRYSIYSFTVRRYVKNCLNSCKVFHLTKMGETNTHVCVLIGWYQPSNSSITKGTKALHGPSRNQTGSSTHCCWGMVTLKLTENKYSLLILWTGGLCRYLKKTKKFMVRNTLCFKWFWISLFPLIFLELEPWNILPDTFYYWLSSFLLSYFLSIILSILISLPTFAYIGFYFTDFGLGAAKHEKLPTGTCYVSKSHCGVWGWNGGICGDQKPQKDTEFSVFCSLHESCMLRKPIYYLSIAK